MHARFAKFGGVDEEQAQEHIGDPDLRAALCRAETAQSCLFRPWHTSCNIQAAHTFRFAGTTPEREKQLPHAQ